MVDPNLTNKEQLISKLDSDRKWLLKNIDSGKCPEMRSEIAHLEREISKLLSRLKDHDSKVI